MPLCLFHSRIFQLFIVLVMIGVGGKVAFAKPPGGDEVIGAGDCVGPLCGGDSLAQKLKKPKSPVGLRKNFNIPKDEINTLGLGAVSTEKTSLSMFLGKNYKKITSGLTDCHIPFDKLKKESKSCKNNKHRVCEQYSASQFPEVVSLLGLNNKNEFESFCTGTLISHSVVLTAAHCLLSNTSTQDMKNTLNRTGSGDLILASSHSKLKTAVMRTGATLTRKDRSRQIDKAIIHEKYGGLENKAGEFYKNDIALLILTSPYPKHAVEPVVLPEVNSVVNVGTVAGYGYSDRDGNHYGRFSLAWPEGLKFEDKILSIIGRRKNGNLPTKGICMGDSGGPLFAGRVRGCQTKDKENRPRKIQGVSSYLLEGDENLSLITDADNIEFCSKAESMVFQNLAVPKIHQWICKNTGNQVVGCKF